MIKGFVGLNARQRERCGRLLYAINKYDKKYWEVDEAKSEKEYIRWFVEKVGF